MPFRLTEAQIEKVATAYALETGMDKEAIVPVLKAFGSVLKGGLNVGKKVARLPGQAAGGAVKGTLKGVAKTVIKHPMAALMTAGAIGTGVATAKKHKAMTGHGRAVTGLTTEMRRQQNIDPRHQWSGSTASGMKF